MHVHVRVHVRDMHDVCHMHVPQGALLAEGVPEQLLQLLLQAEPGPNQQRLLEALHCLSARTTSDTLPAPLCSPACVARLLLLASDAELMSGGDRVRPLASPLHSRSRTLRPLYFRLYRWLRYTRALLLTHGSYQVRLLTATLLTKLAHETPTALLLAHGQDALRTLTLTLIPNP